MMNKAKRRVLFRLDCVEEKVLLVIGAQEDTTSCVLEMQPSGRGRWETTIFLTPGEYRARSYVGDDRRIIYYRPAFPNAIGCVDFQGVDAMVCIRDHDSARSAPRLSERSDTRSEFATDVIDQAAKLRCLVAQRRGETAMPNVTGTR
jgi:hypothetical protein